MTWSDRLNVTPGRKNVSEMHSSHQPADVQYQDILKVAEYSEIKKTFRRRKFPNFCVNLAYWKPVSSEPPNICAKFGKPCTDRNLQRQYVSAEKVGEKLIVPHLHFFSRSFFSSEHAKKVRKGEEKVIKWTHAISFIAKKLKHSQSFFTKLNRVRRRHRIKRITTLQDYSLKQS